MKKDLEIRCSNRKKFRCPKACFSSRIVLERFVPNVRSCFPYVGKPMTGNLNRGEKSEVNGIRD